MMVFRSICRPLAKPPRRDPFEGALRKALGEAKARRKPVTFPGIAALSASAGDAVPVIPNDEGRRP